MLPDSTGASPARSWLESSWSRREHRQAGRGHRPGRSRAALTGRRPTVPTDLRQAQPSRLGRTGPGGRFHSADALLARLAAAGHPVIRIDLADPIDIGGEFIRWEVATAIAGVVLGIDAFDQPNVEEAKILTRRLLARHGEAADARLHEAPSAPIELLVSSDGLALVGDAQLNAGGGPAETIEAALRRHLARAKPNAYLASRRTSGASPRTGVLWTPGSGPCCAIGPAGRPPPATVPASSIRPASSTRGRADRPLLPADGRPSGGPPDPGWAGRLPSWPAQIDPFRRRVDSPGPRKPRAARAPGPPRGRPGCRPGRPRTG